MKKLIVSTVAFTLMAAGIVSCEKETTNQAGNQAKSENFQTRAQGEAECEMKAIKYRGYIDCTKEGTGCKVECEKFALADDGLLEYLSGLDANVDNTTSLKSYLADLTYIAQDIQHTIQEATELHILVSDNDGTTVYGVLDNDDELIYAFSFND